MATRTTIGAATLAAALTLATGAFAQDLAKYFKQTQK
jgi:hypothetical protein